MKYKEDKSKSMGSCKLYKFSLERIPGNKMVLPLGVVHPQRGKSDDDGIVSKEGNDANSTDLHIVVLLFG